MQYVNKSEVARLKQEIEADYQASKNALHGFKPVAKHEAITRSMEVLWDDIEKLERVAGKEACKQFLMRLQ